MHSDTKKRLIINADDFGLSAGTNAGIIRAFQAGAITSATAMTNTPGFVEAAELAQQHPELGVGLHFNLSEGRPLTVAPHLVDAEGLFHRRNSLEKRALLGLFNPQAIERELRAQYQRLLDHGIQPTHIDSHQHVHVWPAVARIMTRFCRERGLPMRRPWLWRPAGIRLPLRRRLRSSVLQWLVRRMAPPDIIITNHAMRSAFDLGAGPRLPQRSDYETMLNTAWEGTLEIMVHPAVVDSGHTQSTDISNYATEELRLLCEDWWPRLIRGPDWQLGHYGNLADP